MYNSGSINPSGDLGRGVATHCYVSDIANRLLGWVFTKSTCTLDDVTYNVSSTTAPVTQPTSIITTGNSTCVFAQPASLLARDSLFRPARACCDISREGWSPLSTFAFIATTCSSSFNALPTCAFAWYATASACSDANRGGCHSTCTFLRTATTCSSSSAAFSTCPSVWYTIASACCAISLEG
jgi:hypothetical protein